MSRYRILVRDSVRKDLSKVPVQDRLRIEKKIDGLALEPRPSGCIALKGTDSFRVRQGNYRILYSVADDVLVVEVIKIGHRRDVYR